MYAVIGDLYELFRAGSVLVTAGRIRKAATGNERPERPVPVASALALSPSNYESPFDSD